MGSGRDIQSIHGFFLGHFSHPISAAFIRFGLAKISGQLMHRLLAHRWGERRTPVRFVSSETVKRLGAGVGF